MARMEEHPTAISVKNLVKKFSTAKGTVASLDDVSFEVPLGKICVLLGPNGSGKTTLLKVLAGLLRPTSGSYAIDGIDGVADPRGARAKIGWMPAEERAGLYGRLSGRQNLAFFGALQGVIGNDLDRAVGNLALQIGINDEMDKSVLKTSTGAKQKIALTRALLHNPPVVLLDEPTRNLDPHTVLRFRRLLRDHLTRQQKKTVLLSTHQLEEARKIADVIVIISKGKMIRRLEGRELEAAFQGKSAEEFYLKAVDNEWEDLEK
jgi:ABC-type multidrug transport system ATPase subunit